MILCIDQICENLIIDFCTWKNTLEAGGEDAKNTLETGGKDAKNTLETSGEDPPAPIVIFPRNPKPHEVRNNFEFVLRHWKE